MVFYGVFVFIGVLVIDLMVVYFKAKMTWFQFIYAVLIGIFYVIQSIFIPESIKHFVIVTFTFMFINAISIFAAICVLCVKATNGRFDII
jgi:hypothetical protein